MTTTPDRIDDAAWAARRKASKIIDDIAGMPDRASSAAAKKVRETGVTLRNAGEKLITKAG